MRMIPCAAATLATLLFPDMSAQAQDAALAKPNLVLQQLVEAMPRDAAQDVRVLTATLKPGDRTVHHSHRFPVTVYILEGAFTLELNGKEPITIKAGEAFVEPPGIAMTGFNRSSSELTKVVIFYVSSRDTPFLDPVH